MANKKLLMIVSKGSMDMAYPPLMLATTAAAMGMEAALFFTFWGMDIITRKKVEKLKVAPVGNPALPIPGLLGILPGMSSLVTTMMKGKMRKLKMPPIYEMIRMAKEGGVKFYACTPTMGMVGLKREDLIPEVDGLLGATAFLEMAGEQAIVLFI